MDPKSEPPTPSNDNSDSSAFNDVTPTGTPRARRNPNAKSHGLPPKSRAQSANSSMDYRSRQYQSQSQNTPTSAYFRTPMRTPVGTPGTPMTPQSSGMPKHQRNDLSGALGSTKKRRSVPSTPISQHDYCSEDQRTDMSQSEFEPTEVDQSFVWGTNVNVHDVSQKFTRFMKNFREDNDLDVDSKYIRFLDELVEIENDVLNIDAMDIYNYDRDLYQLLVKYPLEVIPIFDDVAAHIAENRHNGWLQNIQARIFNLKDSVNMRELNPSDIDQLICVKGMVIRASSIIPDIKAGFFRCLSCGHSPPLVLIDRGKIVEPTICQRQECLAKNSMQLIHNRSRFANKQVVRLQETPDSVPEGETPHTVSMCMYDNLVDTAKPGDKVVVTGVYRAVPVRVASAKRTLKSLYKTYIDCIHIKKQEQGRLQIDNVPENGKTSENFMAFAEGNVLPEQYQSHVEKLYELSRKPDIYEVLTRSLAPSIWELDDIKKGLLCQLFGGTVKKLSSGAQFRGDLNILLVGDPGTSKSQLLHYVHKIAPRGIYTSGRGSSAVGLTAYVTKDPETREMVLESGALVLSDKGICCIDEFDKMSENARSMLHEVMEQQTVSVAKAGIIANLNARTSILASANPSESRYNPRLSVIDNIQLPPTLLSRFDLIYLILDKADEQYDRKLAKFLISLHYQDPEVKSSDTIDPAILGSYISYARMRINPTITNDALEDLTNFYVEMRKRGMGRKVISATPRQLESLIRISESLARMRYSNTVERVDVAEAKRLLEVAMQQSATDPNTGTIDMDLITTGISQSERAKRSQIVFALREFLLDKISTSGTSIKINQIWEEMKTKASADLTLQDVREALGNLQTEAFIVITNGDNVKLM